MSQAPGTFFEMTNHPVDRPERPVGAGRDRWRLNRAGIVNVYQYENEVLNFGGGRLLLRGVNGSGKSTAMNMLLPFLLTTRQARIDAAGEQRGILKSWMLDGRDDAQPVGYLWIEFERAGRYLVCGCGIKANRRSDTVTTWWFVTEKRPGIDFRLVERGSVPLSVIRLRSAIDPDRVFGERHRREYRRTIEERLFGGASVGQHMRLIDRVRTPRVGDRIDLDLPAYLVDALPQLSEQALAEAASPLDDLEEHRRNVAELQRTSEAIGGLLDVYRSYCLSELREQATGGRDRLDNLRRCVRHEKFGRKAAEAAASEVGRLDDVIGDLEDGIRRLRSEIAALEESRVYRSGQELDALRDLVANLTGQHERSVGRVTGCQERVETDTEQVVQAQSRSQADLIRLNDELATASRSSERSRLVRRPPGPVAVPTVDLEGVESAMPVGEFCTRVTEQEIGATDGAILQRQADIDDVERARARYDAAEQRLHRAESEHKAMEGAARRAAERLRHRLRHLETVRQDWAADTRAWASQVRPLMEEAGLPAPTVSAAAAGHSGEEQTFPGDHDAVRDGLLSEVGHLSEHWRDGVAEIDRQLARERAAVEEAAALVAELKGRTRLDAPRLGWQIAVDHCLADLLDFEPDLGDGERACIEAALESSGVLSARLVDGAAAELASGELVAIVTGGVSSPLSDYLNVTIPDRLIGEVDEGMVAKLLESISWDARSDAATVIATDGTFRVGALRGRHSKERAEFIGVAARVAALDRARSEAAELLLQATAVVADSEARRAEHRSALDKVARHRASLPSTGREVKASAEVEAASEAGARAEADEAAAVKRVSEAERAETGAWDAVQRVATTLSLPTDRSDLNAVRDGLLDLRSVLERCRSLLDVLKRSVEHWRSTVERRRVATAELRSERDAVVAIEAELGRERARLATIEKSIGKEYSTVLAERDRRRGELEEAETGLPGTRRARDRAVGLRAESRAAAVAATNERVQAEQSCAAMRQSLAKVLDMRGFLVAVADPGGHAGRIVARSVGSEGLREMLPSVERLLPAETPETTSADSVRQSLMRRRDTLGAGWDAEARQPDPALPLLIEVTGPLGRAPLADSVRVVSQQHRQLASLLDRKQSDALRGLLQGLIAREIAEKIHDARRLVELMNKRLDPVTTAHRVGVRLRWRRSRGLDQTTARMVQLFAKLPDLRTEEEETELRRALSDLLDDARARYPDLPYRRLIADTLDYKKWHEMSVMVRRSGAGETKLGRRTPLSEGEKKLVTYLPLFAAVAASYDALAEQNRVPEHAPAGIARFILLDDAFAKVSADNHPALFGLLVDLDLDFVATSERLWGTHRTVPELAITEVVRDAVLGVILLEHYRWHGVAELERCRAS